MKQNKNTIHLDLLFKSFINLRADLDVLCDTAVNKKERAYAMGRLAGFDMAISLLEAYQQEILNQELEVSPPPYTTKRISKS